MFIKNFKNLKHKVFLEKQGIKKPTNLLALNEFGIVNKKVSRKYGFLFSGFLTALMTKYQSLNKNERFNTKKEFWYTEQDSFNDMGISYYMRKKLIKIGIEYKLWKVEAKYNPNITGINKLDHFTLDWDEIVSLIINIDEQKDNQGIDDEIEAEELMEEINDITIVSLEEEITDKDIEQYSNEMSRQDGIKSNKSYMLELMDNATNPTRNKYTETRNKIKLWKKTKLINKVDNYAPGFGDKKFEHLKDNFIYAKNEKFFIKGILEKDNQIHIAVENINKKRLVLTLKDIEAINNFTQEYIYNPKSIANYVYRNYDTGEHINE